VCVRDAARLWADAGALLLVAVLLETHARAPARVKTSDAVGCGLGLQRVPPVRGRFSTDRGRVGSSLSPRSRG